MNNGKKWFESKTFAFNILALIVAVAGPVLAGYGYTGEVPTQWAVFIPAAITLINMILRAITKQPIVK